MLGLPEPVSAMDTDFRARIRRQDVLDAAGVRFGALDTNHHGYLLLGELPETPAQARHKAFRGRPATNHDTKGHERGGGRRD